MLGRVEVVRKPCETVKNHSVTVSHEKERAVLCLKSGFSWLKTDDFGTGATMKNSPHILHALRLRQNKTQQTSFQPTVYVYIE